ncbi:MAG: hypothetical protein JNN15_13395 [Blastocatellia bacterium]|nr:hypothetical protein [Blastocatellia bacterium]
MKQDILNRISRIIVVSVLVLGVSGTSSAACFLLRCSSSACMDVTTVADKDSSESSVSEHSCCKSQENSSPSCHSEGSDEDSSSSAESLAEIAGASSTTEPSIPLCCFPLNTDNDSALTEQTTPVPTVTQASYTIDFTGRYLADPVFIGISEARLNQADRYLKCCVFRI